MDYDKWLALGKEISMSGEALIQFVERKEKEWKRNEKENFEREKENWS